MKRVLTLATLFFLCEKARSQSTCDTLWYKLLVKSEVTCYIPAYFPYIDLELEVAVGRKNAVIFGGGPIIPLAFPGIMNGKTADKRRGYILTPSIKRYIDVSCDKNNLKFVSLDFLYRDCYFRSAEKFVHTKNELHNQVYSDTIEVFHQAWGLTANFGQMLYFGNAGLEFSVGIGAEYMRHVHESVLDTDADFEKKIIQPFWQKKEHVAFRLPTRIRLFYRF